MMSCMSRDFTRAPEITASSPSKPLRSSWQTMRVVALLDQEHARAGLELLLDEAGTRAP